MRVRAPRVLGDRGKRRGVDPDGPRAARRRRDGPGSSRRLASGDATARSVLEEVGTRLGEGIAGLVNMLDPELVIVGGGAAAGAGDLLLEPARRAAEAGDRGFRASARGPDRAGGARRRRRGDRRGRLGSGESRVKLGLFLSAFTSKPAGPLAVAGGRPPPATTRCSSMTTCSHRARRSVRRSSPSRSWPRRLRPTRGSASGVLVTRALFRPLGMLAKEAAGIAEISGRTRGGRPRARGSSSARRSTRYWACPYPPLEERTVRLGDASLALRALFRGEPWPGGAASVRCRARSLPPRSAEVWIGGTSERVVRVGRTDGGCLERLGHVARCVHRARGPVGRRDTGGGPGTRRGAAHLGGHRTGRRGRRRAERAGAGSGANAAVRWTSGAARSMTCAAFATTSRSRVHLDDPARRRTRGPCRSDRRDAPLVSGRRISRAPSGRSAARARRARRDRRPPTSMRWPPRRSRRGSLALPEAAGERVDGLFWSFGSELSTAPLIEALRRPRRARRAAESWRPRLEMRAYRPGDSTTPTPFGAEEPVERRGDRSRRDRRRRGTGGRV